MQLTTAMLSLSVIEFMLSTPYGAPPGFIVKEGDILEEKDQSSSLVRSQVATIKPTQTWASGIVPLYIDSTIRNDEPVFKNVTEALNTIMYKTGVCVTFPDRTDHVNYVKITGAGRGCWSPVGRTGGQQTINIGSGCGGVGVIMHEILHTLGMWHEHSRTDRAKNVILYRENVMPGMWDNFDIRQQTKEMAKYNKYDYGSLLHYKYDQFSSQPGKKATILPRETGMRYIEDKNKMGQRKELSDLDVQKIIWLYNCANCSKPASNYLSVVPYKSGYRGKDTVSFQCGRRGDILIGATSSVCMAQGHDARWLGAVPICVDENTAHGDQPTPFSYMLYQDMEAPVLFNHITGPWSRSVDKPLTAHLGPVGDHTYQTLDPGGQTGVFYYLDTQSLNPGYEASFSTPDLGKFSDPESSEISIFFFYSMYGVDVGELKVNVSNGWDVTGITVWNRAESTPDRSWYCALISVTVKSFYRIKFMVTVGSNQNAVIALDDVLIGPKKEVDRFAVLQHCPTDNRDEKTNEIDSLGNFANPDMKPRR